MSNLLIIVGSLFLLVGFAAALVALWVAIKEAGKPAQSGVNNLNVFNPVDAVKALAAAPLWLALAAGGAGLIVLGAMFDGWRIDNGGLTQTPAATVTATSTATP